MLTLEQIIDLQNKGFSWEQISIVNSMDMSTPENPPTFANEAKPENAINEAKPENAISEASDFLAKSRATAEPESDRVKALEDEIGKLTDTIKAMQSANVRGAQAEPKKIETVDDIIKSFMVAS